MSIWQICLKSFVLLTLGLLRRGSQQVTSTGVTLRHSIDENPLDRFRRQEKRKNAAKSSPLYCWALDDEDRFSEVTDSPDYKESGLKKLKSKSWESIARWEKENEFLFALIEDESEWLMHLFPEETVAASSFFTDIEDGVLLCKLARLCQNYAEESAAKEKAADKGLHHHKVQHQHRVPIFLFHIHSRAKCRGGFGKFMRRENVELFLKWCRLHGIPEPLLFESNDVVERTEEEGMRENAREIVLCLMEVARLGVKYGVDPPKLIQLEREIELEERMEEAYSSSSYSMMDMDSGSISPTSTVDSGVYESADSNNYHYYNTNNRPSFDSLDEEEDDYTHTDNDDDRDKTDNGSPASRKITLDSSGRNTYNNSNDQDDENANDSTSLGRITDHDHDYDNDKDKNSDKHNEKNNSGRDSNVATILINNNSNDDGRDDNIGSVSLSFADITNNKDKNDGLSSNSSNSGNGTQDDDTSLNIECTSSGRTTQPSGDFLQSRGEDDGENESSNHKNSSNLNRSSIPGRDGLDSVVGSGRDNKNEALGSSMVNGSHQNGFVDSATSDKNSKYQNGGCSCGNADDCDHNSKTDGRKINNSNTNNSEINNNSNNSSPKGGHGGGQRTSLEMKNRRRLNPRKQQGANGKLNINDDKRKKSAEFTKTELHKKVGELIKICLRDRYFFSL